jgi:transposase-like protein
MPAERTIMRQVREVLRLKFVGGVPIREIARRMGVAASTVRATIRRFQAAGLSWPLPEEMTDAVLEAKLFADAGTKQGYRRRIEPDWASIHRELKRKHDGCSRTTLFHPAKPWIRTYAKSATWVCGTCRSRKVFNYHIPKLHRLVKNLITQAQLVQMLLMSRHVPHTHVADLA